MTARQAYDELCAYTLTRGDTAFIHQHVVDAFAAQTADEQTKPIKLTFALAGLCLHVERGFTGREVQLAHQRMARQKRMWPRFALPDTRGSLSALDVLSRSPGSERDEAIHAWSAAVWNAFRASKPELEELLAGYPELSYPPARSR